MQNSRIDLIPRQYITVMQPIIKKNPCPDNGTEVPLYEAHEIDTITDKKKMYLSIIGSMCATTYTQEMTTARTSVC